MLALLLLLAATLLGVRVAAIVAAEQGPWTRLALGSAFAQLGMLCVPFWFALSFDFSAARAGVAALGVLSAATLVLEVLAVRKLAVLVRELYAPLRDRRNRASVAFGAALMLLFAWLLHTHYLRPSADGLHSAGVTWGDIPLHAAFASRFLHAEGLAELEHPLFVGGRLLYPFLPDYSVSVLAALGLSLRSAFIAGGLYGLGSLLLMLHASARFWLRGERALEPVLASGMFLFAGGLGFVFTAQHVLEGASLLDVLRKTNATYDISPHIVKAGHIGNLFIAARCASYGMPIGLAAMLVLGSAIERAAQGRAPRAALIGSGIAAGALPLVHTHSFLVTGGVVGCYLLVHARKLGVAGVATCAAALAALALPQIAFLSGGRDHGFIRVLPGFLQPAESAGGWLLDLALGMGPAFLLLPFAWRVAEPRTRRWLWPLLVLLPLANLVAFTPAAYDNIKLVAWFDVALAVLLAGWLAPRLRDAGARRITAVLTVLLCTLSGMLAVAHELVNDVLVVPRAEQRLAEMVEQHTPASAVVATGASYHDAVAMLSGRRVLMAAPDMVRHQDIPVVERARAIAEIYAGGPAALSLIAHYDVYAVVVGPTERRSLPDVNEAFLTAQATEMHEVDGRRLYVLKR